MKRIYVPLVMMLCSFSLFAQQTNYLIEAEQFRFKGGWTTESNGNCMGSSMLRVMGGASAAADALSVINVTSAGEYAVWVRSADYTEKQGTRLFRLLVDEKPMDEAGKHGVQGFAWEKVGSISLQEKQVLLRLKDTRKNFARCDAVLLTTDVSVDPNKKTFQELAKFRVKPLETVATSESKNLISLPLSVSQNAPVLAEIKNEKLRMRFLKSGTSGNSIVAKTEYKVNGQWISPNAFLEDHRVYLLSAEQPALTFGAFYPGWNGSRAVSYFMHDGHKIELQESQDLLNPFMAGDISEAIPVSVVKSGKNDLEVKYVTRDRSEITGIWTILPGAAHVSVTLRCKAAKNAYYSMALAVFQGMPAENVTNIELPPMFQYKRITDKPVMLLSAMMPQPVAIAETKLSNQPLSVFISGDTSSFPLDWGSSQTSPMGFSIKNESNLIQPVAFAPVLGQKDSKLTAGQAIERNFALGAITGGWNEALEYISEKIYQVKDYRRQQQTSLTETAFNIIDLLKNDEYGGWNKDLKGFYDIEADPQTAPTVVHSAPLALVSAAVITGDEELYRQRALPAIEYTLSRSGFRWAQDVVPSAFNNTRSTLLLNPYNSQFSTAYYEGLYQLLGQANPWLKDIALPNGQARPVKGYSVVLPAWGQDLAAYRFTRDIKFLNSAKEGANRFMTNQVYSNTTQPMGKMPFYNATMYAYWWDLLDLYELSGDNKYLKAAEASAFHTIAGIRSVPQVKTGLQTIHPGNVYEGNTTLWWKGNDKFRLGFPRVPGDAPEKKVESWLVSPVGLGFEQPFTYFDPGKTVRPVYMSSWAPHLLRLYQYTGREIFRTYARNAVIGRFANYPGYYATGFSDINMTDSFPYKGPDISSVYYHHIPPHLAFTCDFLITEAIQRSAGKISFPYVKQDGFVWFTNRIYGHGRGQMYNDQQVKLWMNKGLVSLNTPEVNYLTAVSGSKFWLILLNESVAQQQVTVRLSPETGVAGNVTASLFSAEKNKPSDIIVKGDVSSVPLAAKGYAAVAFPLSKAPVADVASAPVTSGMKVIDAGAPWGKLFLFRIRSPFGWDSIYGFAETAPVKGASVAVSCNGQNLTCNQYPFEWSFLPFKADEQVVLKMKLQAPDGNIQEQEHHFNGVGAK